MNAPLPLKFYSYARFTGKHSSDSLTLSFDLSLLDEQGTELVSIEEFTVVKIGDAAKLGAAQSGVSPDQFFDDGLLKSLAEGVSPIESVSPAEGVQIFDRVLSSGLSRVIVSTRNLQARIAQSRAASRALISGKAQQAASQPRHPRPQLMTIYAAPRNQVEQKLAEIWQEVLGIDQIGVHDNFFELGGDSLLITRVHARFIDAFEQDMSVANLMQYPTIADLAQQLGQADNKAKQPSFDAVRERTSKQKEAMQMRKQKILKQSRR
jgi:acyl carrier protein